MRLMVLSVMGLIAGLGLAWAIVTVPVMAEKGPLRDTLLAHLGGGEEEVPGGGDPDGEGRAPRRAPPVQPQVLRVQVRVLRRQPPAQLLPPRPRRVRKQGRAPLPPAMPHWRRLLLRRPPRCRRNRPLPPSPPPPRRLAHQLAHRLAHRLVHRLAHQRLMHRRLLSSCPLAGAWRCPGR
jgi:hypothetical protein